MPTAVSRRGFLKGATGAAVVAGVLPRRADAQGKALTVWHTEASEPSMKAVQRVCDKFEQTNPGVKVNQQGIAWADLGPKLYTAMAAGTPPDIAQLNCYHFRSFQKNGAIVPIDDVYQAVGLNDVVESVRDMTLFQGKRWGISHHVGAPAIMIRRDVAEQAGFKVPEDITKPMFKTWAEQIEYLKAVTKPDKRQWGMSLPGTGYFLQEHLGRWVGSNGGRWYDEKWNPQFTKPEFIGGMEFVKSLADAKVVPPDWLSQSWLGMIVEFSTGVSTMIDHGYGRIAGSIDKYAPEKANEQHFFPIQRPVGPMGKTAYTDMDAEIWVVFSKSKFKDLAKAWIKLFFTRDLYLNYVAQYPVHMPPILKSIRNDPEYKALPDLKRWPNWVRMQELNIDQGLAIPVGVYYPASNIQIPFLAEVFDSGIIADELVGYVQGRRKVQDAAQRINDRVTDLIRKLGYKVPDPIRSEKKV
jgi:ABC-type glycerol-3-phosphate transport system substrate-binding protein